jgi:hypothetical protein
VFAMAIVWKLASPDFLTGAFFEYTLVVDPRFEPIARLLGISADDLEANRLLLAVGGNGTLVSNASVGAFASALTVGTLLIEGAVAILWLAPGRLRFVHHTALGVFAVATYVLVPVVGFGITLLIMAVAATLDPVIRRRYAMGAAALFSYGAVWNLLVL